MILYNKKKYALQKQLVVMEGALHRYNLKLQVAAVKEKLFLGSLGFAALRKVLPALDRRKQSHSLDKSKRRQ